MAAWFARFPLRTWSILGPRYGIPRTPEEPSEWRTQW